MFNFSAGPAVLPEEVLSECAASMMDFNGTGMSVMEMSHRSAAFQDVLDEAEADLRSLMSIPDNYKVLFLQGGDSLLFSTVFMNLALNGKADYVVSGNWSKKAFQQAQILGDAKLLASSEGRTSLTFPMSPISTSAMTPALFIFAKTRPSRVPAIPSSPIPVAMCSSPISPR